MFSPGRADNCHYPGLTLFRNPFETQQFGALLDRFDQLKKGGDFLYI